MKWGAELGGVLGVALSPLVLGVRWRRQALDAVDPWRLFLGAWLAGMAGAHLVGMSSWAAWAALAAAVALVSAPTVAAWRGVQWLRRVYGGTGGAFWVDSEHEPPRGLPLLVSGQHPLLSDAVLMRATGASDPYRDTAAPRCVARVCPSLPLQLRPLYSRIRVGALLLAMIAMAGIVAGSYAAWPKTTAPIGAAPAKP